jgi:hypothetical protein
MDDRLVRWRCAHRGSLPSTDIRQIPGGCEAKIALLTGLGNQNAKRDLAFQVLIGRLSNRFDRRIVLAALGLGFAGAAVALVLLDIDEVQKVESR